MKPSKLITLTRNIVLTVFTMAMVFTFSSCATKAKFAISTVAPAARGDIKVTTDKNKNYKIKIEIFELAEVERLQPARKSYVVWLVADNFETKNIGRITSSTGTFSKKLKASFETVTSFKPTKIFITAEDDSDVSYPSTEVVLSTDTF
ncbi:MAG: hypothetical protein Q7U54_07510 [Bacteroidales bacterium]|nr:hypothetical protein [Bacteroidales bacterium]